MNNSTNDTGDCSPFDTSRYVAVAVTSAAIGFISVLACAGVIAIIVLYKKYYFHTQRVILYLNIVSFLNSVSFVLRLQRLGYKSDSEVLKVLCIVTAAFDHITAWCELIAISCITIDLFIKAVFRKETYKLEMFYVFMIFIFPLTFNWIPFIDMAYGEAGAWCWIRSKNQDTCKEFEFGTYLRFGIWYIPLYLILTILIILYVVIIWKLRKFRHKYTGVYDPDSERLHEQMQKEIMPLMMYPVIYFFLNIFPLMNRVHDTFIDSDPILALWILQAIFSPLQGGFIALAYTLDMETLKRLKCAELRATLSGGAKVSEYPARQGHTDSFNQDDSTTTLNKSAGREQRQYNSTDESTVSLSDTR